VYSFEYFESMVNTDSATEKEIKERGKAGNMAYRVHKKKSSHQN